MRDFVFVCLTCIVTCLLTEHVNAVSQSPHVSPQDLLKTEEGIIDGLEDYLATEKRIFAAQMKANSSQVKWIMKRRHEREENKLDVLEKFLEEAKVNHTEENKRSDIEYLHNPYTAFVLIKNFLYRWKRALFHYPVTPEVKEIFEETFEENHVAMPGKKDLESAARSLYTIQNIYNISLSRFTMNGTLGFADLYDIGIFAYENSQYRIASKWLEAAIYQHAASGKRKTPFDGTNAAFVLSMCNGELGEGELQEYYLTIAYHMDKQNHRIKKKILDLKIDINTTPTFPAKKNYGAFNRFIRMCYGVYNKPVAETDSEEATGAVKDFRSPDLFCYDRNPSNHPYELQKVEVLYTDPDVLLFHNFMSQKEIDLVISEAEKKEMSKKVASHWKVNNLVELSDTSSEISRILSRRISRVTGLDTAHRSSGKSSSGNMHIMTYGISGYDTLHLDAYKDRKYLAEMKGKLRGSGNRIATFAMTLEEPYEGGKLIFPWMRMYIEPVKGSGLLWFNTDKSGDVDTRALYGSCPVVYGKKRVAFKWIHEAGNENRSR